ncbi:MAG: 4Fe-4S binding protein [Actinomycetia bacterium]|nr:4Fe-4S binding protein [Actinomycetes bacterium]
METDYKSLKEGGFMRQVQKNNFSARIKVVGGRLTAEQLVAISAIARKYGAGHVHLTSRQSVEIPFVKLKDVPAVRADLEAGGLKSSVCGPRVRTVTACQGSEICPSGCIDTYPLALAISERYFGRQLVHKFKFGVTGCMNNCLKAEENDMGIKGGYIVEWLPEQCNLCGVCIKACREGALAQTDSEVLIDQEKCNNCGRCVKACPFDAWHGEAGYILSFGGIFGNRIAVGQQLLPIISDEQTLFRVADAVLAFFDEHAEACERFRSAIDRVGWDVFQAAVEGAYHGR